VPHRSGWPGQARPRRAETATRFAHLTARAINPILSQVYRGYDNPAHVPASHVPEFAAAQGRARCGIPSLLGARRPIHLLPQKPISCARFLPPYCAQLASYPGRPPRPGYFLAQSRGPGNTPASASDTPDCALRDPGYDHGAIIAEIATTAPGRSGDRMAPPTGKIRITFAVILATLAWVAAWVAATPAGAQTYPDRTIKIVVPFTPGGPVDLVARLVAQRMAPA